MTVEGRRPMQYELPPPFGNGHEEEVNDVTDQATGLTANEESASVYQGQEVVVVYIAEKPLEKYEIQKGAMLQPIHGGRGIVKYCFEAKRTGRTIGKQPVYVALPGELVILVFDGFRWQLAEGAGFTVSSNYVKSVPDNRNESK